MPRNDFNGDGRSDILWMFHENVAVSNWLTTPSGGFSMNDASAFNWLNAFHIFELKATGDFNGDGRTDVLWNVDESPFHSVWLASAEGGFPNAFSGDASFQMGDVNWSIVGTGDFNGDGVDDLLWRNADGRLSNWLGGSAGSFVVNDANAMVHVGNNWGVVGTGDFDGDGRSDILWQSDDGWISTWLGTAAGGYVINDAAALMRMRVPVAGIGDFNADGRDDIVIVDDWSFYSVLLADAEGGFKGNPYQPFADASAGWTIHGIGDYNRDGMDDLLMRNASGAVTYWLADGSGCDFVQSSLLYSVPNHWQIIDYLV
jgi:hypothetical protein